MYFKGGLGLLWARDKDTEKLTDTLNNGIAFFKNKYGAKPNYIECSFKSSDVVEFIHDGIPVIAKKRWGEGVVWMTIK